MSDRNRVKMRTKFLKSGSWPYDTQVTEKLVIGLFCWRKELCYNEQVRRAAKVLAAVFGYL